MALDSETGAMVADDPSNAELARRLDQIYVSLQGHVGRAEYTEYQRNVEHRFTEMQRDLDDALRVHSEDVRDLHKRISDESKALAARAQWRTTIMVAIFPTLAAITGILVTIWLAKGK